MTALVTGWWQDRSARERLLIGLMLALLAGTILWLGVWRPITALRTAAEADARAATARLAQARAHAAAIAARPAAAGGRLADLVSQRLAQVGLQAARMDAAGDGQVVVELAAINGRLLLGWAAALEQRDGLVIEQLDASRNPDQSVHARLLVRRAQ
jgi:general secretion pathway protein M